MMFLFAFSANLISPTISFIWIFPWLGIIFLGSGMSSDFLLDAGHDDYCTVDCLDFVVFFQGVEGI